MFFQRKSEIAKTVVSKATYRKKKDGAMVLVNLVSKPVTVAELAAAKAVTTNVVGDKRVTIKVLDGNYVHSKKECSCSLVCYTVSSITDPYTKIVLMSDFLERCDLVVGYTKNGTPITEADVERLNQSVKE